MHAINAYYLIVLIMFKFTNHRSVVVIVFLDSPFSFFDFPSIKVFFDRKNGISKLSTNIITVTNLTK